MEIDQEGLAYALALPTWPTKQIDQGEGSGRTLYPQVMGSRIGKHLQIQHGHRVDGGYQADPGGLLKTLRECTTRRAYQGRNRLSHRIGEGVIARRNKTARRGHYLWRQALGADRQGFTQQEDQQKTAIAMHLFIV